MGKASRKKKGKMVQMTTKKARGRKAGMKNKDDGMMDLENDPMEDVGMSKMGGGTGGARSKAQLKRDKYNQKKRALLQANTAAHGQTPTKRTVAATATAMAMAMVEEEGEEESSWGVNEPLHTQASQSVTCARKTGALIKRKNKVTKVANKRLSKASRLRFDDMLAKVVEVLKAGGVQAWSQTHPLFSWLRDQRGLWLKHSLDDRRENQLNHLAIYDGFSWLQASLQKEPFFKDVVKRRTWSMEDLQQCVWVQKYRTMAANQQLPAWATAHLGALIKDPSLGGEDIDLSALSF